MPPRQPGPPRGKRPANNQTSTRVRSHTRNGRRVRSHSRAITAGSRVKDAVIEWVKRPNVQRVVRTAGGAASAGAVAGLLTAQAFFTVVSFAGLATIAAFSGLSVLVGMWAENNGKKLDGQARRRSARRKRRRSAGARSARTTSRRRR